MCKGRARAWGGDKQGGRVGVQGLCEVLGVQGGGEVCRGSGEGSGGVVGVQGVWGGIRGVCGVCEGCARGWACKGRARGAGWDQRGLWGVQGACRGVGCARGVQWTCKGCGERTKRVGGCARVM